MCQVGEQAVGGAHLWAEPKILLSILLHSLVLEKLYFQSGLFLVSHYLAHTHVNNMPQPFLNLFLCPYLLFVSRYRMMPMSPRAVLEYFLLVYGFLYIFFNLISYSRVQNALFRNPRVILLSNPNVLIYLLIYSSTNPNILVYLFILFIAQQIPTFLQLGFRHCSITLCRETMY